jgi:hypothetical protein
VWLLSVLLFTNGQGARGQGADTNAKATSAPGARAQARPADLSLFSHSENCVACHNNLLSPAGEDVSIGIGWRSTMMANSARDPYWQAGVRREVLDHPARAAEIQDECAACHMPMAQKIARAAGRHGGVFDHLPVARRSASELDRLASDGVSCTVCHQIAPDGLGTRDSFNANFAIAPAAADGKRLVFGPYRIDHGRTTIMRSATGGFAQAEATHLRQSELCASCHTLITQAFGPNGEVIGSLPEQMNYQEWQHSDFNREQRSCQSCHMPAVEGPVRAASVLGDARESLSRHVFVGGNAYMLRLLNRYRAELGVSALPSELEATANATLRQLQRDTATLELSPPALAGGTLAFDVQVSNLTGHKLPTGYPSRRVWLHVKVVAADGATVFESGSFNADGSIAGNDQDRDPRRIEPHYAEISAPDQVQIWEAVLGDIAGAPTTGLLTATQYLKDNRLLPRGFDKTTAAAEIGVYGEAVTDPDFTGAGDRVRYRIAVPSTGPFAVEVELRYQSIAFRWARTLDRYDAPETKRFAAYFSATASASSVVIATSRK